MKPSSSAPLEVIEALQPEETADNTLRQAIWDIPIEAAQNGDGDDPFFYLHSPFSHGSKTEIFNRLIELVEPEIHSSPTLSPKEIFLGLDYPSEMRTAVCLDQIIDQEVSMLPLQIAAHTSTGQLSGAFPKAQNIAFERDLYGCRVCGFRSSRWQTTLCIGCGPQDVEGLVTVCPYCRHIYRIADAVRAQEAVLLHLPEISPERLSHAARELYLQNEAPSWKPVVSELLAALLKRAAPVQATLRAHLPETLAEAVERYTEANPRQSLSALLPDVRVFPLPHLILDESPNENAHRHLFSSYRAPSGTYGDKRAGPFLWLRDIVNLFPDAVPQAVWDGCVKAYEEHGL